MNKAQLQACLASNGETLAEAENTLRRIQAEPYSQRPYFPELNQKELRLVLTYKWYDMIDAGEKLEEYRDLTKFYRSRIEGRDYDIVTFYRGYAKDRKTMSFKYGGYRVGTGQEKWGAVPGKQYYVIKLGERL